MSSIFENVPKKTKDKPEKRGAKGLCAIAMAQYLYGGSVLSRGRTAPPYRLED